MKPKGYYRRVRKEILPLLRKNPDASALDIEILDRDHLCFFSLRSARRLAKRCGYRIAAEQAESGDRGWATVLKRMPVFREFAVCPFLLSLARSV